jgi:aspartyl/glutamyl-tRNA(Asn/Gln) amidotransferase C subunit
MSDFNIQYVARLARIALTPEEEQRLGDQLGNILGYIAKLREVDVSGVEPMSHAFPCRMRLRVPVGCLWFRTSWSDWGNACCTEFP